MTVLGCAVEATENQPAATAADHSRIAGTVLETFDVPSYTYVRLETSAGEAWAAVPQASLEIGTEVEIMNPQVMSNFESKSLGRTFETIYFGALGGRQPSDDTPIQVERAGGATGRTIAELYAERAELSGKTVALRGKVVKYTAGIMSRNWIHLQDGTGDAAAGTDDITVTSTGTTAVGQTILVEGVVSVDKDFGAGYRYAVIVEDASIR
jgi:hypothetical protein